MKVFRRCALVPPLLAIAMLSACSPKVEYVSMPYYETHGDELQQNLNKCRDGGRALQDTAGCQKSSAAMHFLANRMYFKKQFGEDLPFPNE